MKFTSFDRRRTIITAGLATIFGIAALAGQGGASPALEGQAKPTDAQLTLVSDNEQTRALAGQGITRSMAVRDQAALAVQAAPAVVVELPVPQVPAVQAAPPEVQAAPAKPAMPVPVAGLDQKQMNNAKRIVETAREMGLGKRAQTIAIATALQESQLYNLANPVYAESHDNAEGVGYDHDSVGLFQQRPVSGWGTVENLMKPEYAARQFLKALIQVPGWEDLPLTVAAQSVQVSAFPDHYAKHEGRATEIVDALQ